MEGLAEVIFPFQVTRRTSPDMVGSCVELLYHYCARNMCIYIYIGIA